MEKISVYVETADGIYRQKLMNYLRKYYAKELTVEEEYKPGAIMISDRPSEREDERWVYLCFEEGKTEGISPYQSVKGIINCIREKNAPAYGNEHSYEIRQQDTQEMLREEEPVYGEKERFENLIGVYSPIGGCGKTAFAMTYCEIAAKKHPSKKVLYWNAEGAADWKLYFRSECPFDMSDLIYCMLMEGDVGMKEYLREIAVGQENGVYFIKPSSFQDLNVLGKEDLRRLLNVLTNYFDYIVCDMNTAFENINRRILQQCGYRYFIMNDLPSGRLKFQDFVENLRKQEAEEQFLRQRCTVIRIGGRGGEKEEIERMESIPQYSAPWCSRIYKEVGGKLQLRQDSSYYDRIRQLVQ